MCVSLYVCECLCSKFPPQKRPFRLQNDIPFSDYETRIETYERVIACSFLFCPIAGPIPVKNHAFFAKNAFRICDIKEIKYAIE